MAPPLTTPVRDANTQRERPLSAIDDNRQAAAERPLKAASPAKTGHNHQRAEEKKRRKVKPSSSCSTPPAFIQGTMGQSYQRGLCIGEGGFARCFQVNDNNGEIYAAKTSAKAALTSEKTRSKSLTEIKVHRAMSHPNIVKFIDCFEDRKNVYMSLEMCSNQSLSDMINHRRHITEPEARYYFVEILGATNYMHSRGVIHRDSKLGNIFLDKDMHSKIGDFGSAARIEGSARRYTVCGTPNYISPEVSQRPHGHSYPTDIWALGIISYAMLVGRPPFQDREIDVIYQRIRNHECSFPPAPSQSMQEAWDQVSEPARDLVARMLHPDPRARPSIQECSDHPWVQTGTFVSSMPSRASKEVVFSQATPTESAQNSKAMVERVGLDVDRNTSRGNAMGAALETVSDAEIKHTTSSHVSPESISPPSTRDKYKPVNVPVDSAAASQAETHQVPVYDSPVVGRSVRTANIYHESPVVSRTRSEADGHNQDQMNVDTNENNRLLHMTASRFRYPSAARTSTTSDAQTNYNMNTNSNNNNINTISTRTTNTTSMNNANHMNNNITSAGAAAANFGSVGSASAATRPSANAPARSSPRPASTVSSNITNKLRSSSRKTLVSVRSCSQNERQDGSIPTSPSLVDAVDPPVILTRWADFEESWGISYTLSDGSVGMSYRDRTSMRMDPVFNTYMYFEGKSRPGSSTSHRTAADTEDPRRRKKIDVLAYVRRYMDRELAHAVPITRPGGDVANGEISFYLNKSNECVMFVMTDGTSQFNFRDHYKAVIYEDGTKLGLVTDQHQSFCWKIADAVTATRAAHFQRAALLDKLVVIHNETKRYLQSIDG